jgi:protein arginine kinase activator
MERLCDCCSNPAVVHETIVHHGVKAEVHLCAEHAVERGYILPSATGPALVVGKLLQQAQAAAGRTQRKCSACGSTMQSIREAGLAGCPLCYRQFEEDLGALITRAQGGASVHVGRHPAHAADLVDRAALRNRLAKELREAVAREEYERAAKIRDRLTSLGGTAMAAFAGADAGADSATDTATDTPTDAAAEEGGSEA